MKKLIALFIASMLGLTIAACNFSPIEGNDATVMPDSIKVASEEIRTYYEMFPFVRTKRILYYELSGVYLDLVPEDECDELLRQLDSDAEPLEMTLITFIKHFNIPREDFEKALEKEREWSIRNEIDLSSEAYELPNVDILYTFANEIIDAYYRIEHPVAPKSGSYTTYESYEEYLRANP